MVPIRISRLFKRAKHRISFSVRRRRALVVLLVLLSILIPVAPVQAQGVVYGDSIPAGTDVDQDVVLYGDTVTVRGTVHGDVVAVGRFVEVAGTIHGSLVAIGGDVSIDGDVDGSVYGGSLTFTLQPTGMIGRSLYFVGESLTTATGSSVGKDLRAVSLGATLGGMVERDTHAVIGITPLIRLVLHRVNQLVRAEPSSYDVLTGIVPAPPAPIIAFASLAPLPPSDADDVFDAAYAGAPEQQPAPPLAQVVSADAVGATLRTWAQTQVPLLATLLLLGALALWLLPGLFAGWTETVQTRPLASTGTGVAVLATGLLGTLLTALLVLLVGMALARVSLGGLAWTIWNAGYSALWLVVTIFMLFVSFGSKVIVAYPVGKMLLQRVAPNAGAYTVWPLVVGSVLYILLYSLPYLGTVTSLLATVLGLGAVWLTYANARAGENVIGTAPYSEVATV